MTFSLEDCWKEGVSKVLLDAKSCQDHARIVVNPLENAFYNTSPCITIIIILWMLICSSIHLYSAANFKDLIEEQSINFPFARFTGQYS